MSARKRLLSLFTAACYLLAISASALFHNHSDHDHEPSKPGVSASHGCDSEHDCSICQFLAQKPAPAAEIAVVDSGVLVQNVAQATSPTAECDVFAAWHSRAPPVSA